MRLTLVIRLNFEYRVVAEPGHGANWGWDMEDTDSSVWFCRLSDCAWRWPGGEWPELKLRPERAKPLRGSDAARQGHGSPSVVS